MSPNSSPLLQVLGRMHPLVLHLPIGLFVGLAVLELLVLVGWVTASRRLIGVWLWLATLTALATAGSGWLLGHESSYSGETLDRHQNLGLIAASLSLVVAGLHQSSREGSRARLLRAYRVALFVTAGVLLPTGHLGATLTHGEDFLFEPLREKSAPTSDGPAAVASTFETQVQPILAARCTACHGAAKHKGKLSLHTREAIELGGESGPVIDRLNPTASELFVRTTLPLEHDDHMPPAEKPQPTADELAVLSAWIQAGAPFDGVVELGAQAAPSVAEPESVVAPTPVLAPEPPRASSAALETLAAEFAHVEVLDRESGLLWIDFSGVAAHADDAFVERLVAPVGEFVGELTLARTAVGAPTLEFVASLPKLSRLDLRATNVDDAALAKLGAHAALAELVLAQTKLTDASLERLLALPKLERVFLWKSGLSAEAVARLRSERPALHVDAGDLADSAAADGETEIKLTSDAPLPGAAPPTTATASLEPVNTKCPVSGSPVNPKYSVVYDGKVIGFCCPNCPKEFWSNPEPFLAKLE